MIQLLITILNKNSKSNHGTIYWILETRIIGKDLKFFNRRSADEILSIL